VVFSSILIVSPGIRIYRILEREAREGRPLGSSLPHVIVNDPYRTVIPPLTQQEIRATAQQVL
ncbi:unnamed protein product, partial [Rotaria sp. Silwood1]